MCHCGEAEQTAQHILGLQESPVAEAEGDLADSRPITRKSARAGGCATEDHGFNLESCSTSVTPANEKIR